MLECWTTAAALASVTEKVELMNAIRPGFRLPAITAKMAANIDHVAIVLDPAAQRIVLSVTFDSLGYRTEYRFTDVKLHASVADKAFRFERPAGVQELKASPTDQGKL